MLDSIKANVEASDHYDDEYFAWQREMGEFGGKAELIKFRDFISAKDSVLDFGCGGGYLLANLHCKERVGVEINSAARENCATLGVRAVETVAEVPDGWADVIISNHALEHVVNPLEILIALRTKLKASGTIIFVVPCEAVTTPYKDDDINQHLFTWSPANLGCLFKLGGYQVKECSPYLHRWPYKFRLVQKILGWKNFHRACWAYGFLFRRLSQVRVIAGIAPTPGA